MRFWYGTVQYGPEERAVAYITASLAARVADDEGRRAHMDPARLADYAPCDSVRGTFEAATGLFLSKKQLDAVRDMTSKKRSTRQINMGFGKSAVVVPMLVLTFLEKYATVIVTQPAHLVPTALRIIGAAVSLTGSRVVVTSNARRIARKDTGTRYVVVCSGSDIQAALPTLAKPMYSGQSERVHIADEIDETSDPLTCERSVTTGVPMPHYDRAVGALEYHSFVCDVVLERASLDEKEPRWKRRVRDVAAIVRKKRIDVDFGLVDADGVYLAVPYRFPRHPALGTLYTDPDVSAVLTAIAVYAACRNGTTSAAASAALERALAALSLDARAIINAARTGVDPLKTMFLLHAILVALPQVVWHEREQVTSFMDLLGISDGFVAFSGTMALSLPVPRVQTDDARWAFMPPTDWSGDQLRVHRDEDGNALVLSIFRRAECSSVPGEYGPDRAGEVVAVLEGKAAMADRQVVVVDASGDLGIVDAPFLRSARGFTDGVLAPGERTQVVYYDKRNARGTDAPLEADAKGYIVVDWDRTTFTEAVQAMYRLRSLEYKQTIEFVVCGTDHTPSLDALYEKLRKNELARTENAKARAALQKMRAEVPKKSSASFTYPTTLGSVDASQRQHQHQLTASRCLRVAPEERAADLARLDPFVLYDPRAYRHKSALIYVLRKTDIHVSPLLVYGPDHAAVALERRESRAFVVIEKSDGARATLVLCALVEIWAMKRDDTGRRGAIWAYTHTGTLLRGPSSPGPRPSVGLVLFGRYLSGASLPLDEQRDLFRFLSARYEDKYNYRDQLRAVVRCLRETGLLPSRADPVFSFIDQQAWDPESFVPAELAFVSGLGLIPIPVGTKRKMMHMMI